MHVFCAQRPVRLALALAAVVACAAPTAWGASEPNGPVRPVLAANDANRPAPAVADANRAGTPLRLAKDANSATRLPGGQGYNPAGMLGQMLLLLLVVLVLGGGALVLARRVVPRLTGRAGRQIQVVETAYLAPRQAVHLVHVAGKRLLLASAKEAITVLAELPAETDAPESSPSADREQGGKA